MWSSAAVVHFVHSEMVFSIPSLLQVNICVTSYQLKSTFTLTTTAHQIFSLHFKPVLKYQSGIFRTETGFGCCFHSSCSKTFKGNWWRNNICSPCFVQNSELIPNRTQITSTHYLGTSTISHNELLSKNCINGPRVRTEKVHWPSSKGYMKKKFFYTVQNLSLSNLATSELNTAPIAILKSTRHNYISVQPITWGPEP